MRRSGLETPPSTVTAEFHVKLRRPTSTRAPLQLRARVVESSDRKAVVEATLESRGEVTCTCRGVFVAVPEGHPAFHPW
jgi:acyl-coenzyme A thioesterase PaaI-like protein